jgi:gamma-glutamylcyclotransferase (GGCT)/AIG2-like uncharacterized protein YtfP
MPHIFTYGSLMYPQIMERVCGLHLMSRPATLHHFRRSRLHNLDYPGIFALKDDHVPGILYLNLPTPALRRLDDFEGDQYVRREVEVEVDDGQYISAMTYVLQAHCQDLVTGEEWDFGAFLSSGKDRFINSYIGFGRLPE